VTAVNHLGTTPEPTPEPPPAPVPAPVPSPDVAALVAQLQADLAHLAAQNAMLIEQLNLLMQKLSEPVEFKGKVLGLPITLKRQ
jgi:hypothetical protein